MGPRITTRAAIAAAASLTVIAPLAGCVSDPSTSSASSPSTTPNANSGSPTTGSGSSTAEYNDGTYTVRGVYGGAPSYMTVTLALTDDTITDVAVEPMPVNNDTSRGYQERFAAAVPDEVIGKSIADLEVGIIAGASGCADGFNDALTKIREQANANQ
ncbi:MAG TPA: hypothetical protein VGC18_06355 [Lacisediminihabitans sp.]|jgi:uncharacterized protein with FMN-binding domain|uniref:FMN-binding protein n=1 Tax=Lacisediminihabitans sp. TaxID=2787631 RepID=UPI002EDA9057